MQFETIEDILAALGSIQERVQQIREILLANLIMIGEIPAPTFQEQRRVDFLQDRFVENGFFTQRIACSHSFTWFLGNNLHIRER